MFSLECDKCGNALIPNERLTIDEYMKDMSYLIDSIEEIQESSVQQYLIYQCNFCNAIRKFTYKEWEKLIRLKSAKIAIQLRKQKMFAEDINPHLINPKNGIEYCGQCDGTDGVGNCLIDIIKQCTMRKK